MDTNKAHEKASSLHLNLGADQLWLLAPKHINVYGLLVEQQHVWKRNIQSSKIAQYESESERERERERETERERERERQRASARERERDREREGEGEGEREGGREGGRETQRGGRGRERQSTCEYPSKGPARVIQAVGSPCRQNLHLVTWP